MRDIAIDEKQNALPVNSFLIYGDTRSGKTEFAATLPRPLIFADVTEGGFKTIQNMDRSKWFEGADGPPPIIKGIDQMSDFAQMNAEVTALIAAKRVMSIVFDAWSYYCDFAMARLTSLQEKKDDRRVYGDLGKHLREVRVNYGAKGVNIAYLCLAKHPSEDDPKGRPMIPGQQADKFAAGVDFLMYARVDRQRTGPGGREIITTHELRTKQYDKYIGGNRLGANAELLPDPFVGTYADFITALGYDVEGIRASMPKIQPIANTAKPATNAAPVNNKVSAPKAVTVTAVARK